MVEPKIYLLLKLKTQELDFVFSRVRKLFWNCFFITFVLGFFSLWLWVHLSGFYIFVSQFTFLILFLPYLLLLYLMVCISRVNQKKYAVI